MEGSEFREFRRELRLTQGEVADALGLSQGYIGEMERGEKPIEKRTELAFQHLRNSTVLRQMNGSHVAAPLPGDVPLADVQLLWTDDTSMRPMAKVLSYRSGRDDRRYGMSFGASNAQWDVVDNTTRLHMLLAHFVQLTIGDKVPAEDVHAAFSVIPEYREHMERSLFNEGYDVP